jgi:glycosyltransferase involved in cell wall biosynthesis
MTTVTISVVTYKRIWKWIKLMRNLKKVSEKCPGRIRLNFLFVEDSKSPRITYLIKSTISKLVFGTMSAHVTGSDNLGESRDLAIDMCSSDWIGFIDDDDYYREDVLGVLEYPLTQKNSLSPSIINFGMSGNFYVKSPIYQGYPEPKNRLRYWDDKNFMGCIPSMACFIRLSEWKSHNFKFGKNIPSEETSRLMVFTYIVPNVYHIGVNLMFRNRGRKSLVKDMSIYHRQVIIDNVNNHLDFIYKELNGSSHAGTIAGYFVYNYGSYLESHGIPDGKSIVQTANYFIRHKYV